MKSAVLFGAGAIGRSFIVPVLQKAGYEMTLIDLDRDLTDALTREGGYSLVTVDNGYNREEWISGFHVINGGDEIAMEEAVLAADLCISSVGQRGMRAVCRSICRTLPRRRKSDGEYRALDLILAENVHGGAAICRELASETLGIVFPHEKYLGIVETSIGKMVPLLTDEQKAEDPLRLFAEPYNSLILDREGFRNPPPESRDILLVSPVRAFVDRKLYVHNMGHAAAAYLGRHKYPDKTMIWEVLEDGELRLTLRRIMRGACDALACEYPDVFSKEELYDHADDLIRRFRNRALGDTLARVGRDLKRKLSSEDRIAGTIRLMIKQRLDCSALFEVYESALAFGNADDATQKDRDITAEYAKFGIREMMERLSFSEGLPDEIVKMLSLDAELKV